MSIVFQLVTSYQASKYVLCTQLNLIVSLPCSPTQLKCSGCSKVFKSKKGLKKHAEKHHPKESDDEEDYDDGASLATSFKTSGSGTFHPCPYTGKLKLAYLGLFTQIEMIFVITLGGTEFWPKKFHNEISPKTGSRGPKLLA